MAEAYVATARWDDAEKTLRDMLGAELAGAVFHGDYRLHAQLAEVLDKKGRSDEASAAWQLAGSAVQRALEAQDAEQKQAFAKLATVRRILEMSGMEE